MGSVRAFLAEQTRDIHEALHHDPVLSRLAGSGLDAGAYRRALVAFAGFYGAVETARHVAGVWPQFSLTAECAALTSDLEGTPQTAPLPLAGSANALLGALYVAHGAGFGRAGMRANCLGALPDLPHRFMQLPPPSLLWRDLLGALEATAKTEGRTALLQGAASAFSLMDQAARMAEREHSLV